MFVICLAFLSASTLVFTKQVFIYSIMLKNGRIFFIRFYYVFERIIKKLYHFQW